MKMSHPFCAKLLLLFFLTTAFVSSQTVVKSLAELQPYLDDDKVHVKLAPGEYIVTADDIRKGVYGKAMKQANFDEFYAVFPFLGSKSTYDFTGVTIKIMTAALKAAGGVDFREVYIQGNNNVLKNLTLIDDGDVNDAPAKRAQNIVMDGAENRVEGFHVTVKGSFPYGYGDIFGKGGNNTIGHKKHSACLIRGNSNHVKDCTFIHRSYGHAIFCQAANDPIIEGCYIEGQISSTDKVLAEEGSGSPADKINFKTTWGFDLRKRPGYRFSLQEDGIRAYSGGKTIVNGVIREGGTHGMTVKNCTVVNMRSGVTIGWATGKKQIENCTVLACETGYWIGGESTVVNCRGDSSMGPLYSEDVGRANSKAEMTLLDDYLPKIGDMPSLYFAGNNHDLTLYDGTTSFDESIILKMGGKRVGHRWLAGSGEEPLDRTATRLEFTNYTKYPLVLENNASGNTLKSCGPVTDNGSNNNGRELSECKPPPKSKLFHAYSPIQAENHSEASGTQIRERVLGSVKHKNWVKYEGVTFGGIESEAFEIILSKEHSVLTRIEVYIDSLEGKKVATVDVPKTGSWSSYRRFKVDALPVTGKHDVYLYFLSAGSRPNVANIDSFKFLKKGYLEDLPAKTNLALSGAAQQSSTALGGDAKRAIDGNTDGNYDGGSVTQTSKGKNQWWGVQLAEEKEIKRIVLFNRTDDNKTSKLSKFKLTVYDVDNKLTFSKVIDRFIEPSLTVELGGIMASKIKIQLNGFGSISLAELEVY